MIFIEQASDGTWAGISCIEWGKPTHKMVKVTTGNSAEEVRASLEGPKGKGASSMAAIRLIKTLLSRLSEPGNTYILVGEYTSYKRLGSGWKVMDSDLAIKEC